MTVARLDRTDILADLRRRKPESFLGAMTSAAVDPV